MTPAAPTVAVAEYRCEACDTAWSYRAVRNVARCPDCQGGLVRLPVREVGATAGAAADQGRPAASSSVRA